MSIHQILSFHRGYINIIFLLFRKCDHTKPLPNSFPGAAISLMMIIIITPGHLGPRRASVMIMFSLMMMIGSLYRV